MRPSRTFLFLLTVVVTLSLLLALFEPMKWKRIFYSNETTAASELKADSLASKQVNFKSDSLHGNNQKTFIPSSITGSDSCRRSYFPGEALIDTTSEGKQFRIMVYGDSQLEGDRMTSMMRSRLCHFAGGTGTGLFSPVMPVMYTRSFAVKSSSNWKRYTWLDYKRGRIKENKFGPALTLCRFLDPGKKADKPQSAWVRIVSVPGADSAASVYNNLRVLYNNLSDTVDIKVYSGNVRLSAGKLLPVSSVSEYCCPLSGGHEVRIEFEGKVSPDIYAISIEGTKGVVVDNIPLRGSAGLEFVMTNEASLRQSMALLKPDLIILQYGLNVVRNVKSNYSYYEEGLVKQIKYLKRVTGNARILLVSVTDMAETKGDSVRYFSNIPAIRDAQKRAAERTGILFWDAWSAMGGKGSAVRWAEEKPPLVLSDLTHFSQAGADTLSLKILTGLFYPSGNIPNVRSSSTSNVSSVISTPGAPGPAYKGLISKQGNIISLPSADIKAKILKFFRYDPEDPFIFTSPAFWIFLLIVLSGFSMVARNRSMRNAWLLLVSLWFYYKAGGLFFILLLFTSLVNYIAGLVIYSSKKKYVRRLILAISVITGLGLLGYFKYASFLTDTVNSLLNTSFREFDFLSSWSNSLLGTRFDVSTIVLPVGISFFTFQALSYTIDIYREKVAPVRNPVDFAFYVSFFPHLVAGPIVRASEFVPQMYKKYSLSRNEWSHALFLILQGLIKKMIISDFIATGFVDRIFDNPSLFSGFENLLAVYGYGIQIYCDFSGYTDIAIGIALLMGFRLPVNFNSPYKAPNISDFWKRWHISLSRWLKDYLYIPLGGNRKGSFRTGLNLMVTMLLGGLWHGASVRFVLWGGLHGTGLVINKIWKQVFRKRVGGRLQRTAGIFVTFNFVIFAWIFFRTSSWNDAIVMINRIFTAFDPGSYKAVLLAYMPSLALVLTGYLIHFVPSTVKESYRGVFIRMPLVLKFATIICICLVIYKVGTEVTQPFIYFRF